MGKSVKSAKSISIIGCADGPTSVFIAGRSKKNLFERLRMYLRNKKYRMKRKKVERSIVPGAHTMEETIRYMKQHYGAVEADASYPYYEERKENLRYARVRRARQELFAVVEQILPPEDFGDEAAVREWQRQLEKQDEECRRIAGKVSQKEVPTDYHLFLIDKAKQGQMEIEIDTFSPDISISYSGDKKIMEIISKDIHRYFGVSQEDIDQKTERYRTLVTVLST